MTATLTLAPPTPEAALHAGPRWLSATEQPAGALAQRRGARITTTEPALHFAPLSNDANPLTVIDLPTAHRGVGVFSAPLKAPRRNALPALASERAGMGIPTGALHDHGITETITLDAPAHPGRQAAALRYDRGCPRRHTHVCQAQIRAPGMACSWHTDGHRRAIWPTPHIGSPPRTDTTCGHPPSSAKKRRS